MSHEATDMLGDKLPGLDRMIAEPDSCAISFTMREAGPCSPSKHRMKIAIEGCCHGELHKIYSALTRKMAETRTEVSLLIICGDFQAMRNEEDLQCMACPEKYRHMGDFVDYYNGTSVAPIPTIFVGGNHEASNHMRELHYGGWVCPNIFYLGSSGVVNFGGLRIAGISGIHHPRDYRIGYYEKMPYSPAMVRSAYHYREFEIKKLLKITEPVDIFISHEWPTGIYHHGNVGELLRRKPYFRKEIESNELGAEPLARVLDTLQPKHWLSAHLHVGFEARKDFDTGRSTSFLALDKCLPNRDFLRIIDIPSPADHPSPRIEYDAEWLTILRECEPFMNTSSGYWRIPDEFYDSSKTASIRKELESELDAAGRAIEFPVNGLGSGNSLSLSQTRRFRQRFLSPASANEECKAAENPEEIELDL